MKRRDFITLVSGAVAGWPVAARTAAALPLIGFPGPASPTECAELVATFRQGLSETGYAEGYNVAIEFRWAEGKYDRLPAFAGELVQRKVSVIAGMSLASALAATVAAAQSSRFEWGRIGRANRGRANEWERAIDG